MSHTFLADELSTDPRTLSRPEWIVAYVRQNLVLLDRIMSGGDIAQNASDIEALGRVCAHRT